MVQYVVNDQLGGFDQATLPASGAGTQETPVIARLSGGGFVTAWHSGNSVITQLFDTNGARVGGEYVATFAGSQPALVGLANGGFAVGWSNATGIQFRLFDGSGVPSGATLQADAADTRGQQPSLATLLNGNLVVAWNSTGSDTQLKARVFDPSGTPVTADIAVATGRSTATNHPVVTALTNGSFVVSWSGEFVTGQNSTVYAQLYSAAGQPVGSALHIEAPIAGAGQNFSQSIAALTGGGFAMSWTHSEGAQQVVQAQGFDAVGHAIGAIQQVNADGATAAGQSFINALEGGGFSVSWQQATSDGGPNAFQIGDVRSQIFDGNAARVGAEFTVNQNTAYGQGMPAAASFGTGDLAYVFQTFNAAGDGDVAIRQFFSVTNGTPGNDTLNGTPGIDILRGFDGMDTLSGGLGNDILEGGNGNDTLNGGGGNDQVLAGDGNDTVIDGDGQGGQANLGTGDDLLRITGTTTRTPNADGGVGIDTVRVENTSYLTFGNGLTGFEKLVLAAGGNFQAFSGYQQITLAAAAPPPAMPVPPGSGGPTVLFNFIGSNDPGVDLAIGAGQSLRLTTSSFHGVTASAGADNLTLGSQASVATAIDLGAGDDQFTIDLLFPGTKPAFVSVAGGAGIDYANILVGGGQSLAFDLGNVTGFETVAVNGGRQEAAIVQLSHVADAATVVVGSATTLTLSQSTLPDALLQGAFGGGITLASGTVVDRYGFPDTGPYDRSTDLATRDASLSVAFTNNGTVENGINFYTGDDRYDGRLGSVGGTVHGNGGNDTLLGGAGNERLAGDKGDDVIDGGGGYDVALFAGTLAQSSVVRGVGGAFTVTGPDGTDRLSNVEAIQFSNGVLQLDSGIPVFDNLFYAQRNPDVFASGADLSLHYRSFGAKEGRDPNAFFSTAGYLAANPDIARAGADPLAHYDQQGWREGRDPSARFDTTLYLLHNPDVARAGVDPLAHYLTSGRYEGRQAYAAIGGHVMANGFDPDYYLLANPDVAKAGIDPYQHYSQIGWKEGRNPNAWFDDAGYLARYKDVADLGINPLQHYHDYGWKEGRDPSAAFDTKAYLAANPDVAQLHIDPLVHYLQYGAYEMRDPHSDGVIG